MKRKIVISSIIACFFIGTFVLMWQAVNVEIPESERCDGGHSCAMKYAEDLQEMKEEKKDAE